MQYKNSKMEFKNTLCNGVFLLILLYLAPVLILIVAGESYLTSVMFRLIGNDTLA